MVHAFDLLSAHVHHAFLSRSPLTVCRSQTRLLAGGSVVKVVDTPKNESAQGTQTTPHCASILLIPPKVQHQNPRGADNMGRWMRVMAKLAGLIHSTGSQFAVYLL
jgi:hypothetical protein